MTKEEAIERIKTRFNNWMLDDNDIDAIKELIPDLKKSEDERITKDIIQFFRDASNGKTRVINSNTFAEWAEYLEKQPTNEEMLRTLRVEYEKGVADTIAKYEQKEQKPAEKHDLVAQLKEHLANTPKEQLEAEWKELEPWGNIGPTVEEYLYGKPAEWSEVIIQKAIKEVGLTQHQINWFKTNVFPPKQEWSEEDENAITTAIRACRYMTENFENSTKQYEDTIKRLKSLRPQPHTIPIKDATKFGNLEYERGVKDGIQSIKSCQWRPSEEQMRTLEYYMGALICNEHKEILFGLYEQLKSL